MRSFTESDLLDTDSMVPFENTTLINQNRKGQGKRMQSRVIRLIGEVFSKGAMLSVSDKSDSVNECTEEINQLIKLHIPGVWQNADEFMRQLANRQ